MKVKFLPQNVEFDVNPGQSVLNVAHDNGVHIQSVCKGIPSCAECRVRVVEGVNNILPPMAEELNLIGSAYFVDQRRLSCQMRCFGDVVVDLEEQVAKEHISTKQPQGKIKKETGDSSARMGSMFDDAAPAIDIEITEEERIEAEKNLAETEARKAKEAEQRNRQPKKKSKNNRQRNGKKASGQGGSQGASNDAKGSSGGDKPKKKNNRNRNRNRNKKKAGSSPQGSEG
jgi:ferredoxin